MQGGDRQFESYSSPGSSPPVSPSGYKEGPRRGVLRTDRVRGFGNNASTRSSRTSLETGPTRVSCARSSQVVGTNAAFSVSSESKKRRSQGQRAAIRGKKRRAATPSRLQQGGGTLLLTTSGCGRGEDVLSVAVSDPYGHDHGRLSLSQLFMRPPPNRHGGPGSSGPNVRACGSTVT